MAVTVTVAELAVSLRIIAEIDGAIDPAVAAVLTRHRAAAVALVEHYAPLAPAAVQDEAATRVVGYLHDAPAGIIRTVNVARASGATALLAPWRGTGAAAAPSGGDSVVAPGGPGTDQVARDAAAAAQAAAVAARAAADRAQMTADAAAAAVQDASVSADDQVARDAAAEARALAVLAQGSADSAERLAMQAQRTADAAQVTATAAAAVAANPTDQVARAAAAAAQSSADAALAASGGGGGDGLLTVLPPGEDLPVCTEADYLVGAGLIQGATRFYATRYGHSEVHSSWRWRTINTNVGPFSGTAREYLRPGSNQVPMWPGGDLPDGFLGVVSGGPATAALEIGSLDESDEGAWAFDGHARRWLRFVGGNFAVSNPPPDRDLSMFVRVPPNSPFLTEIDPTDPLEENWDERMGGGDAGFRFDDHFLTELTAQEGGIVTLGVCIFDVIRAEVRVLARYTGEVPSTLVYGWKSERHETERVLQDVSLFARDSSPEDVFVPPRRLGVARIEDIEAIGGLFGLLTTADGTSQSDVSYTPSIWRPRHEGIRRFALDEAGSHETPTMTFLGRFGAGVIDGIPVGGEATFIYEGTVQKDLDGTLAYLGGRWGKASIAGIKAGVDVSQGSAGNLGVFADLALTGSVLVSAEGIACAVLRASAMEDWDLDVYYRVIGITDEVSIQMRISGGELMVRIQYGVPDGAYITIYQL